MFLFVFAGAKRGSCVFSKFQFWYLPIKGLLYSASKKSQEVLVTVVFFLIYFAALSLVFELKQNLEAQPYPEMNS